MEPIRMKAATTCADLRAKLVLFAICSRIFILFLSWISNVVIPDHDAGVYTFPEPAVNRTFVDDVVNNVFGGLARWDAQYFLHIAHFGYTYENTLAFFPLFPFLTRTLSRVLDVILKDIMNSLSTVLVSALALNTYFFVNAALKLFDLSCKVLKDDTLAYKSALFFCINPASIFFTAPYSESCFAFFTFSGMLFCIENDKGLLSSFALGLSSCVRSNGVINFGYLAHQCLKNIFMHVNMFKTQLSFSVFYFILIRLYKLCIYALVFFAPFLLFQGYAYNIYCNGESSMSDFIKEYGKLKGFIMPSSDPPPWCEYTIPFSYFYVQNHYWDVGFLKYYIFKQIPNFLLASPMIFLVLRYSYTFMLQNKEALFSLGFTNSNNVIFKSKNVKPEFFVFVVHSVVLTVFCTLFVHIQVSTRMIASSCPAIYWFVALHYKTAPCGKDTPISSRLKSFTSHKYCLVETRRNMDSVWRTIILTETPGDVWSYCILAYFCSYFFVGTILFSNFLPWT